MKKKYSAPDLKMIMIDSTEIIAQSYTIPGDGWGNDEGSGEGD